MSTVLDDVVDLLAEVLGEDFLMDTEVTADTSFNDDLALESIEFVELSEKIQDRYGQQVNLVDFISAMDIDGITAITVGQLVGYIEDQLAAAV
jgi:acyl carrier protein